MPWPSRATGGSDISSARSTDSRLRRGLPVTPGATAEPHVSVVVTTFNQGLYIAEAIRSVLAQTYTNREIIVVDDGSTDDSPKVLAGFGNAISTIRQPNQGVAGARNRGIRAARGLLLAFLDGDDRWHPEMLRRLVEAHERFPDSGLIACDARSFEGDRIIRASLLRSSVVRSDAGDDPVVCCECLEHLILGNVIATTTQIMIPRRVIDDVGLSDPAFRVSSDYDLYLRIALKYRFTFVREQLADWRYLPTSVSGPAALRHFVWTADDVAILRKFLRRAPPAHRPSVLDTLTRKARRVARQAYRRGRKTDQQWARAYLWHLCRKSGGDPVVAIYLVAALTPAWIRSMVAAVGGRKLLQLQQPARRRRSFPRD
jgi:glycosyltransferase involved in cell wall biosynthesis